MDYGEVNTTRGRFQAGYWPQFIEMLSISGLHGWTKIDWSVYERQN